MIDWTKIAGELEKAFEGTNAPWIDPICNISRKAEKLPSWWVEGIFEIIEELLNSGYVPSDDSYEHLFQAVAMLETVEKRGVSKK